MGEGLATLAWLDFASWDRERALDIIAQLREKETRDELGEAEAGRIAVERARSALV